MSSSVWGIELNIEENYIGMIEDLVKYISVVIITRFLWVSDKSKYFSKNFFKILLFPIIGILFYWLIIKKIIIINKKEN